VPVIATWLGLHPERPGLKSPGLKEPKDAEKKYKKIRIKEFQCFETAPWSLASLSAWRRLKGSLLEQGSP